MIMMINTKNASMMNQFSMTMGRVESNQHRNPCGLIRLLFVIPVIVLFVLAVVSM